MTDQGGNRESQSTQTDVKYFQTFFGPQLRPNARMPLEAHRECGCLLNQIARATEGRRGACEPVNYVCNTLNDWVMGEHNPNELNDETLAGLYRPGPRLKPEGQPSRPEVIRRLERVKFNLAEHYPGGLALQRLLRQLDVAITSICKWDGKPRGKIYREPSSWSEIRLRWRA